MDETTLRPLRVERQDLVYEDRNQRIFKVLAYFAGFSKEYYVSDHGVRAALLAVRRGDVLLARQYRLLINDLSFEIPGGKVDEDEAPEAAAIRECLEETGVRCANPQPLISYHPSLDIWKNYTHIFYSEDVNEPEGESADRLAWIPLGQCIDMIFSCDITDSLSIVGLLAYHTLLSKRHCR